MGQHNNRRGRADLVDFLKGKTEEELAAYCTLVLRRHIAESKEAQRVLAASATQPEHSVLVA